MSKMIQCDGCKKIMYEDSRSEKGSYVLLSINLCDQYHLCRNCYVKLMKNILNMKWNEDEEQWEDTDA